MMPDGNSDDHCIVIDPARLTPLELTGRARTHVEEPGVEGCALHPLARSAYARMVEAARADGLELAAVSGFRPFEQQLAIWNGKFRGERPLLDRAGALLDALALDVTARVAAILVWSALPGASRHHWGTDLDVIDRAALPDGERVQLVPAEYAAGGWFAPLDEWLTSRAADFGFFRPYDVDRGGVLPEPWHLSFAPVATLALPELTVDVLAAALLPADLGGRDVVLSDLPALHERYVLRVAAPPERALAAPLAAPALSA
jgi:LAS superfamily LD-carboxypeptidase LdcB